MNFTDEEKSRMLISAGYNISSRDIPLSRNPNSYLHLLVETEILAKKGNKEFDIHLAFESEVKPIIIKIMEEFATIEQLIKYKSELLETNGMNKDLLYDESKEEQLLKILKLFKERYASSKQNNIVTAMPPEEYLQYIEFKEFQNYKKTKENEQSTKKTTGRAEQSGQNSQQHQPEAVPRMRQSSSQGKPGERPLQTVPAGNDVI